MLVYSIGISPLIKTLHSQDWIQTWCVDGSSCIEKIEHVKNIWESYPPFIIINYLLMMGINGDIKEPVITEHFIHTL